MLSGQEGRLGLPVDLYRLPVVGHLLRKPLYQRTVQIVLLLGYCGLVLLGVGRDSIPGVPELHPRMYTHGTTLLFWVFWLMGLVLLVPLLGRAWCSVCPLGLVTDVLGRQGLGLSWPRWIRSGVGTILAFAGGVGAVVWADAHKSPHGTALLIGAVGALALVSALAWRRSAFCKGLCPVGSVLHLYSRHAPLSVRPADAATCRGCADRSCTKPHPSWRRVDVGNWVFHRKTCRAGCPVALHPSTMDTGACLLCLRCVRNCSAGNLGVFWGEKNGFRALDRARAVLLWLVAGLVGLTLLRTWPALRDGLTPGVFPPAWFSSFWIALALPTLLLAGPAVCGSVMEALKGRPTLEPGRGDRPEPAGSSACPGLWAILGTYLPAFVGPVLGGHAALALVKLNAKAAYLPYLSYDPTGAFTYLAIHVAKLLPLPDLLVPLTLLRWLALLCFALGVVGGVREGWSHWPRSESPALTSMYGVSLVLVTGLFGSALVHWLF